MTKKAGEDDADVVEMDAMDGSDWDKDQHTPIVQHDQLSKLVQASSEAGPAASSSARTANTVRSQTAGGKPPAPPTAKKDATPARSTAATLPRKDASPATPTTRQTAATVPRKDVTPAPARQTAATVPRKDATPAPARQTAPGPAPAPAKRPIRPAAVPPSATRSNDSSSVARPVGPADSSSVARPLGQAGSSPVARPLGQADSSSVARPLAGAASKPNDASGLAKPHAGGASPPSDESGVAKTVSDSPSAARRLPLPAPRAAGRTAPPPARSLPTPRGGAFAFASTTPAELGKSDAPAKPETTFERDEDLAIPRTSSSESVVIGPPITTTRDSLDALQPVAPEDAPTVATAPLEVNPFDDQVWRAEGGSDSSADVEIAGAHPIVGGNPLRESIVAFAKNKRNLAIAGGAVVVLIVLIAMVSGDKPTKTASGKRVAKTEPAAKHAPAETPPAESPPVEPAVAESPPAEAPPAESPAQQPPAETPSEGSAHAATSSGTQHTVTGAKKKTGSTIGGKQVVLEYDTQAREAKPVPNAPKDDQAAIGKARTSYAAGNTRLFSGDADGAIKNYKQALGYYPAYVAAYRGLGLAYAQKGDKPAAIKALRTYVGAVPSAKDAGLIRKRIQMLGN